LATRVDVYVLDPDRLLAAALMLREPQATRHFARAQSSRLSAAGVSSSMNHLPKGPSPSVFWEFSKFTKPARFRTCSENQDKFQELFFAIDDDSFPAQE
jgi:hypothetical protein